MKLQTTSKINGFTLLEIMIVVSIISVIARVSLFFNFDNFHSEDFYSQRNTLVSALQHARSQSMANICRGTTCTTGKPYGIIIQPPDSLQKIVLFQTERDNPIYSNRTIEDAEQDIFFDTTENIEYSGSKEISFESSSGNTSESEIRLNDSIGHSSIINIHPQGQITWTH